MIMKNLMTKAWMKCNQFLQDQRGDAAGWAIGIFFSVLLLIVVYSIFKEGLTNFIQTQIFGRMNNLE